MKPLAEMIKELPAEQFVDWLCLACVDVREVRTPEDAQEEINKIREAVTERLATLEDKLRIKQNHIRLRDTYIEEMEAEQSEHDEQIATLQGKFDLALAGFRSKTERCEKAETKLAELDKQEPVADVVPWNHPNEERTCDVWLRRFDLKPGQLFYRPAPAVSLAELVPDEMHPDHPKMRWVGMDELFPKIEGWNDCRAAILRNIEEAK